jgi:rubrerythrin
MEGFFMNQTIKNLTVAFVGESQARNRYTFWAKVARTEGYEQIAAIFLETADQERKHASTFFSLIQTLKANQKEPLDPIHVETDAGTTMDSTLENLKAAAAGENHEWTSMYQDFAGIAEKEGFREVAIKFKNIAIAEKHHEERYKKFIALLEKKQFFKREEEVEWVCRECGYVHKGKSPPLKCPSCDHAQGFYQRKSEDF